MGDLTSSQVGKPKNLDRFYDDCSFTLTGSIGQVEGKAVFVSFYAPNLGFSCLTWFLTALSEGDQPLLKDSREL